MWKMVKKAWLRRFGGADTKILLALDRWIMEHPGVPVDHIVVGDDLYDDLLWLYPYWDSGFRIHNGQIRLRAHHVRTGQEVVCPVFATPKGKGVVVKPALRVVE